MNTLLSKIKDNKDAILIGEIAALLHDIGKSDKRFIQRQSIEGGDNFKHADIKDEEILPQSLIDLMNDNDAFSKKVNNESFTLFDIITKHHNRNDESIVIKTIIQCDNMDSADDKGIVRRKQPVENTIIATPFGFKEEKIDLDCLEKRKDDLSNSLENLFNDYLNHDLTIEYFRNGISNCLRKHFIHVLGETRIPANDVTLWHHSYSTASLFKTCLASLIFNKPDATQISNTKWQLLGICWNGLSFIQKARKIGDIKSRTAIIEELKKSIRKRMEVDYPLGNAVYEDVNGLFFTFPDLTESEAIAKEICSLEILPIIQKETANEMWPFFTLSAASRSMTKIAGEIRKRDKYLNMPKMSPIIFINNGTKDCKKCCSLSNSPSMPELKQGEDICSSCQFRTKGRDEEICTVCKGRRQGRLENWRLDRNNETIWTEEVADKNGRVALLTLRFDLSLWLNGDWFKTIFSQSYKDWANGNHAKSFIKGKSISIEPSLKEVYNLLEKFFNNKDSDKEKAAKILNTFFEENIGLKKSTLCDHSRNIKERIGEFNKEHLATYLFTQNPSPARLHRIWDETENFFDLLSLKLKKEVYTPQRRRFSFKLNKSCDKIEKNTTYWLTVPDLDPSRISCLALSNEELLLIDSAGRFSFKEGNKKLKGLDAIKEGLVKNGIEEIKEEESGEIVYQQHCYVNKTSFRGESFLPFITIVESPVFFQILVPALDSIKILNVITSLYKERYNRVQGKLPLHIGLLVAKRKIPLYALLEGGQKILDCPEFSKPGSMLPYWDIFPNSDDPYYGYYPIKQEMNDLDNLQPLNTAKKYYLTPGRFDFDFMEATADRYRLVSDEYGGSRPSINYGWLKPRPYFTYEIEELCTIWDILITANISSTQIHGIEQALISKLNRWRHEKDREKEKVFHQFALAGIKNAFGGKKWRNLKTEQRTALETGIDKGYLLDTIQLMNHVIKIGGNSDG